MKHRSVVASYIFAPPPLVSSSQPATPPSPPPPSSTPQNPSQPTPPPPYPHPTPTRVALFRRSTHPNVRSYQGLLAPISGSIDSSTDASPLCAAARELREETGLIAHEDLRLEVAGPPFGFVDREAGRSWEVWPFGWTLVDGKAKEGLEERLRLDWEHDGWEWVDVVEILADEGGRDGGLRGRCVPRVEESLRRVWLGEDGGGVFGGEECMAKGIPAVEAFRGCMREVREDKENGARVLATRAVRCLREVVEALIDEQYSDTLTRDRRWRILRIAGWHLVHSARPSMNAAIGSAVCEALSSIKPLILDDTSTTAAIASKLDECITKRQTSAQRLAEAFSQHTTTNSPKTNAETINIVTLSSSSSILAALLHLGTTSPWLKNINISILESRPRCEGASLAASLVSALQIPPSTSISMSTATTTTISRSPSTSPPQTTQPPTPPKPSISITILPESHLALLFTQLPAHTKSYLLLGADRISPHGAVLNKTLSLSAAVLAKTLSPPGTTEVVVLAETDKFASAAHADEEGGVEDVLGVWEGAGVKGDEVRVLRGALGVAAGAGEICGGTSGGSGGMKGEEGRHGDEGEGSARQKGEIAGGPSHVSVRVRNETFEWVPPDWVDVYVTEKGVVGKGGVGEICEEKTEREAEVFRGLYD